MGKIASSQARNRFLLQGEPLLGQVYLSVLLLRLQVPKIPEQRPIIPPFLRAARAHVDAMNRSRQIRRTNVSEIILLLVPTILADLRGHLFDVNRRVRLNVKISNPSLNAVSFVCWSYCRCFFLLSRLRPDIWRKTPLSTIKIHTSFSFSQQKDVESMRCFVLLQSISNPDRSLTL